MNTARLLDLIIEIRQDVEDIIAGDAPAGAIHDVLAQLKNVEKEIEID